MQSSPAQSEIMRFYLLKTATKYIRENSLKELSYFVLLSHV